MVGMNIQKLPTPLIDENGTSWTHYMKVPTHDAAGVIKRFYEDAGIIAGTYYLETEDELRCRVVLLASDARPEGRLKEQIEMVWRTAQHYLTRGAEQFYQAVKQIFEDTDSVHITPLASLHQGAKKKPTPSK